MQYETAKCPSCGAAIPVQSEFEQAFCPACGNRIVVKDAIQRHKVELSGSVVVDSNIDSIYKSANGFLQLEKWEDAKRLFTKIIELDSTDYRGWWGMFLYKTKNMQLVNKLGSVPPVDVSDAENALSLVSDSNRVSISNLYRAYRAKSPDLFELRIIRLNQFSGRLSPAVISFRGYDQVLKLTAGRSWSLFTPPHEQTVSIHQENLLTGNIMSYLKRITLSPYADTNITLNFNYSITGLAKSRIKIDVSGAEIISEVEE